MLASLGNLLFGGYMRTVSQSGLLTFRAKYVKICQICDEQLYTNRQNKKYHNACQRRRISELVKEQKNVKQHKRS